jgi:uncharacterized protein (DUF952 family)
MAPSKRMPQLIYKVASRAAFQAGLAAGSFPRMPIDTTDGYIHFSTAAQLAETLRLHFANQADLILISVRTADLRDGLKWEPSRGGDLFPHHYGALGLDALVESEAISVASDGSVALPAWVK